MFPKIVLSVFCLFATACCLLAQSGNPANNAEQPLSSQLEQMVEASNRFNQYKVVPINWLNSFSANLGDSLAARQAREAELRSTIEAQTADIQARTEQVSELEARIVDLNLEKDGIELLGMRLSKGAYHGLVWSIIGLLALGVLLLLGRSRYAVGQAREVREKADKLAIELEDSRKKRLEVEQDLRRKLQDERNKRL